MVNALLIAWKAIFSKRKKDRLESHFFKKKKKDSLESHFSKRKRSPGKPVPRRRQYFF